MDVGDRRIGLAICDDQGSLAVPAGVFHRTTIDQDVARILEAAEERGAQGILVGLPLSVDGSMGPQAVKVIAFVKRLRRNTSLMVDTHDERYSTAEAERLMRAQGAQPSRNKGAVDAAAAAVILQDFLDCRNAGPRSPRGSGS